MYLLRLMNSTCTLIVFYWRQLSVLALVIITGLSLLPLPAFPELPGTDKTLHLLSYAALAFPVSVASKRSGMFVLLFYAGWSGALELLQPFVNRHGEWLDFAANVAGLAVGAAVGVLVQRVRVTA